MDNRTHPRHTPATLTYVSAGAGNGGILLNLSEQGCSLQLVSPPRPNTQLDVEIELEAGSRITATGTIIWVDESGCAGVKFTQMADASRKLLRHWLLKSVPAPEGENDFPDLDKIFSFDGPADNGGGAPAEEVLFDSVPAEEETDVAVATKQTLEAHLTELSTAAAYIAIADECRTASGATASAVAVLAGKEMICRASGGTGAPPAGARLDISSARSFTAQAVKLGKSLRCVDTEADPRVNPAVCRRLGIRSVAAVPVLLEQKVVGVLEVFASQRDAFDDQALERLEALARITGQFSVTRGEVHAGTGILPAPNEVSDAEAAAPATTKAVVSATPIVHAPVPPRAVVPPVTVTPVAPPRAPVQAATSAAAAPAKAPERVEPKFTPSVSIAAASAATPIAKPEIKPVEAPPVTSKVPVVAPVQSAAPTVVAPAPKIEKADPVSTKPAAVKPLITTPPKPPEIASKPFVAAAAPAPPPETEKQLQPMAAAVEVAPPTKPAIKIFEPREIPLPGFAKAHRPISRSMWLVPTIIILAAIFTYAGWRVGQAIAARRAANWTPPPAPSSTLPANTPAATTNLPGVQQPSSQAQTAGTTTTKNPVAGQSPSAKANTSAQPAQTKPGDKTPAPTSAQNSAQKTPASTAANKKPEQTIVPITSSGPGSRPSFAPDVAPPSISIAANNAPNLSGLVNTRPVVPGKPLQVSTGAQEGRLIHRVEPRYPEIAKRTGRGGTVRLSVLVSTDGNVKKVKLIEGSPMFAMAAQEAVSQWKYRPFMLDGKPTEVETEVIVKFSNPQ
jgi:protein TonB